MRFPRINRIRWDKPPSEADRIDALIAQLPKEPAKADPLGLTTGDTEVVETRRNRDPSTP
jgi:hypothetical protein